MRILDLYLKAYGPFTERHVDLSAGSHGLHIVFGLNEAGKSVALRALKALFFGIGEQTPDGFLHRNDKLRVGGRVRLDDGREIAFLRRKGRKNTVLRVEDEQPLEVDPLAACLVSISPDLFSTVFGLDHRSLVEGGSAILEQKGEVGQALFSAALGTHQLQSLLKALDDKVITLFKPRGSSQAINLLVAEYNGARQRMKSAALAVRQWEEQQDALKEALMRIHAHETGLHERRIQENALKRRQRLMPRTARRKELMAEVAAMGPVVVLPEDFSDKHREILRKIEEAGQSRVDAREKLARITEQISRLHPDMALLEEVEAIDSLNERLGSYRKSLADLPKIDGNKQQARNEARNNLMRLSSTLKLDDVVAIRPAIEAANRPIRDLASRFPVLEAEHRNACQAVRVLEEERADLQEELRGFQEGVDIRSLRSAVLAARRSGDRDQQVRDAERALNTAENQAQKDLTALGLWQGSVEAIPVLPVPLVETVDRFEKSFQAVDEKLRSLRAEKQRLERESSKTQEDLETATIVGSTPTEERLAETRQAREVGWSLVKRAWLDGDDVTAEVRAFDAEQELPEAYESKVHQADEVADRLRREADRVVQLAELTARRDRLARESAALDVEEREAINSRQATRAEWSLAWQPCRIEPLSPREMRSWLSRLASLGERVRHLLELSSKAYELATQRDLLRNDLATRLRELGLDTPGPDDDLCAFLDLADSIVASVERQEARQKELQRVLTRIERAKADVRRTEGELKHWEEQWGAVVQPLGQGGEIHHEMALAMLDDYAALFKKLEEEKNLDRRIYGINKDIEEYALEVREYARRVAPNLEVSDIHACVKRLFGELGRSRTEMATLETIEKQASEIELDARQAEARLAAAEEQLKGLCNKAGCRDESELSEAGKRSESYRRLVEDIAKLEGTIVEDGEGAPLEALVHEAETTNPDELPSLLRQVQEEIEELEANNKVDREKKGAADHELNKMTGTSDASDAAAAAQEALAAMREQVRSYMRMRVASIVLRREIERYRKESQSALIQRSGEIFSAITQASFRGISVEIDENDATRLVGIRPDDRAVRVEEMSSGTRDQLYLALRLAALEHLFTSGETLPFIVDDILVNFDDLRAKATLGLLADLAKKTQIILFTHHERIREMAASLQGSQAVFVHELPRGGTTQ